MVESRVNESLFDISAEIAESHLIERVVKLPFPPP